MSRIEEIDVNFKVNEADENSVVYYNCMDKPFSLHGFDMYVASYDKKTKPLYKHTFVPRGVTKEMRDYSGSYEFDDNELREIIINFPLYNGVESLYIGLSDGCTLKEAPAYSIELPMVFYGSSITQGGCTSHGFRIL